MTPQILTIAAFASLGLAVLMVGLMLRQPGWQLRDSPVHALISLGLGLEAALVLGLWETSTAPGLRTGTPMIVLLASVPLAAVALRQGMTPRGVRQGRLQRLLITVPAIGAVALWWMRLDAMVPTGRDLLEQDLLANAAGIATYGLASVVLVACVPLFAAFRQRAIRHTALPFVAIAVLVMPALVTFSGATVEATCASERDEEIAWCRSDEACLARSELYLFRGERWVPQGGQLASYAWQRNHSLELPEVLEPQLYAYRTKGQEHGLFLGGDMLIEGTMSPREATSGLMWVQDGVGACFEKAGLEPEVLALGLDLEQDGSLRGVHFEGADEPLQSCLESVLGRARFSQTCSRNELQLQLVWLGPEPETSASL